MPELRFSSLVRRRLFQLDLHDYEIAQVIERPTRVLHRSPAGVSEYHGVTERGDEVVVYLDRPAEPFLVINVIVLRRGADTSCC